MTESEGPAWVAATTSASLRLAFEAEGEVDDILGHAERTSLDQFAALVARLQASADVAEVASDLAGLLWAEGEDVPQIATILAEPAAREALDVVTEVRRLGARRLADGAVAEARRRVDQALTAGTTVARRNGEVPAVAPVPAAVDPARPVEPESALSPTSHSTLDWRVTARRRLSASHTSFLTWSRRARPAVGRACREVPWC